MSICIITDSTSDIDLNMQDELKIKILPLKISFGKNTYLDKYEITSSRFFEKLAVSKVLPVTSQINPNEFEYEFREILKEYDDIIMITISSGLSGTYQSACIARDVIGSEHIHVIDSKATTIALNAFVRFAVRLRNTGHTALEMVNILEEKKNKLKMLAVVDTLKYLQMGGRLSSTSAAIGTMLNIKPIMTFNEEGKVISCAKGRGFKNAFEKMAADLKSKGGIDTNLPCVFGDLNWHDRMEDFIKVICSSNKIGVYSVAELGAVVGTHTGPGCAGIAYFEK